MRHLFHPPPYPPLMSIAIVTVMTTVMTIAMITAMTMITPILTQSRLTVMIMDPPTLIRPRSPLHQVPTHTRTLIPFPTSLRRPTPTRIQQNTVTRIRTRNHPQIPTLITTPMIISRQPPPARVQGSTPATSLLRSRSSRLRISLCTLPMHVCKRRARCPCRPSHQTTSSDTTNTSKHTTRLGMRQTSMTTATSMTTTKATATTCVVFSCMCWLSVTSSFVSYGTFADSMSRIL